MNMKIKYVIVIFIFIIGIGCIALGGYFESHSNLIKSPVNSSSPSSNSLTNSSSSNSQTNPSPDTSDQTGSSFNSNSTTTSPKEVEKFKSFPNVNPKDFSKDVALNLGYYGSELQNLTVNCRYLENQCYIINSKEKAISVKKCTFKFYDIEDRSYNLKIEIDVNQTLKPNESNNYSFPLDLEKEKIGNFEFSCTTKK